MTSEQKNHRVTLSGPDKEAAARFYREARKALEGLAQLGAKSLNMTLSDDHELMLVPKSHRLPTVAADAKAIVFEGVEITCDKNGRHCMCFDYDNHQYFQC
jgi:hypothetical protein